MAVRKLSLIVRAANRGSTAKAMRQAVPATSRTSVKLARVLLGLGLVLGFGAAIAAPRASADTLPATSTVGTVVFTVTGPVPGDAVPHVVATVAPGSSIGALGTFRDGAYSWAVSDDNLPIAAYDGYKFDLPAVAAGESYTVQFAVQPFDCGGCAPLLGDTVTISADTQTPTPTPITKARLALVALGDDPDAWDHGISQQTWALSFKGGWQFDDLSAGEYQLSTGGPDGYVTSLWSCVAADKTIVPVVDSKVTLTAGSDVTCSITHTKLTSTPTPTPTPTPSTPTATAAVTTAAGPTAYLTLLVAGGEADEWQVGYFFARADTAGQFLGPAGERRTFDPGTYGLQAFRADNSETGGATWVCKDDKTGAAVPLTGVEVTLAADQSVTCTFSPEVGSVLAATTTLPIATGAIANGGSDVELGSLGISLVFLAGGLFLAMRRRT